MFGKKKAIEKRPTTPPSGGNPFRTPGVPIPDREEEPEELPKFLFTAQCKQKGKDYGSDYYTILANTYEEVLHFFTMEMSYEEQHVQEVKRQSTLVDGVSAIVYKR